MGAAEPERVVMHVLPHPGGGGQAYIELISSMPGYRFEQLALTEDRGALEAISGARRARRLDPTWDLVHVHGETAAILCPSLLRDRPGVFNFHGLHLSRRSRGPRLAVVRNRLRRSTALSRGAIASSNSEHTEAAELVGPELASRIVTIESGVEIPPEPDGERRGDTRRELGIADDQVAVIFAAQLEPRKGPLDFLEGLRLARELGAPVIGLLLGSGPLRDDVEARGPAAGARVLGERRDFERLLEASDIFVLPSEREGLSLALLQAMAAGRAVVVADGPGNPETVADTGVVFPFGDADALARELETLAADPALRARLGEAARERVVARYSAERMAREMKELYDRALDA